MSVSVETLTEFFAEYLALCLDRGLSLPFHVTAVGANGSVQACRIVNAAGQIKVQTIVEHIEPGGFRLPVNTMVVDASGQALRVVMGIDRRIVLN